MKLNRGTVAKNTMDALPKFPLRGMTVMASLAKWRITKELLFELTNLEGNFYWTDGAMALEGGQSFCRYE